MSEYKKLPLNSICNHKLIYGEKDAISDDIGIEGTYISESDMKIKPTDTVDGVAFDLCAGVYDNIECEGQHISVGFAADKLHILGFMLWCDIYAAIKVVFDDGSIHNVKTPFIAWNIECKYNWLDIASVGGDIVSHCVISSGKEIQPVFFHHITVDIPCNKKIREIILPENFGLHIFAMTLESSTTSNEENIK